MLQPSSGHGKRRGIPAHNVCAKVTNSRDSLPPGGKKPPHFPHSLQRPAGSHAAQFLYIGSSLNLRRPNATRQTRLLIGLRMDCMWLPERGMDNNGVMTFQGFMKPEGRTLS